MGKYKALLAEKISILRQTGAIHVIVGSFMTKFVSFFGSIFIVRLLSKSEYGILSYYENLMGYFFILAGHGLDSSLLRYQVLADDPGAKKGCYHHALKDGSGWNAALLAVSLIVVLLYPHKAAFRGQFLTAALLMICIPFIFLQNASLNSLRGMYENKSYAYIAFGIAVVQIAFRVIGAAVGGLRLTVGARLAAEILCGIGCVTYLSRKHFSSVRSKAMEKQTKREMDIYSVQLMLTNGLWTIFMLNDVFLLGQFSGNEQIVADYKIAYVIPANLSILVTAVGIFVAPYFTKYDKEKNYDWIREKLRLVLLITSAVMAFFALLCFVLARPLILLLFGEAYLSAVPVMRLLLIASFFNNGIRASIANVLSAVGEQKRNLFVAGGGVILQVLLDCLLIPRFGGTGVAVSSMIVYVAMSAALAGIVYKRYYRRIA